MSLDKAIEHGKEYRKPYKGAKAICKSCRNHGDCPTCLSNRKHSEKKRMKDISFDEFETLVYIQEYCPEIYHWIQEKAKFEHETLLAVLRDNYNFIMGKVQEVDCDA